MEVSSDKQSSESDSSYHRQGDRWDYAGCANAGCANNKSQVISEERRPPCSQPEDTPITSTAAPDEGEDTDVSLSAAMGSASLEDRNLASPQVHSSLSSTFATGSSSCSSLFGKRSPRISLGFGWPRSPLAKVSPRTWSPFRSADMPTLMLTGPVDEELRMSRSTQKDPVASAPMRIAEPHNCNEKLMEDISQGGHCLVWMSSTFNELDLNYRSSARKNRTALMHSVARRRLDIVHTLFKAAFMRGTWLTLSMLDDNGDTILCLAEKAGFGYSIRRLLKCFVAVACCECAESTRKWSVCSTVVQCGSLGDWVYAMTYSACRWGRKLCCREWPCPEREGGLEQMRAESLLEAIDDRIAEPEACDTDAFQAKRQRMLSEWVGCEVFFS